MKQFLAQKLETQIPERENYGGLSHMSTPDEKLIGFLKKNFKFPSNNLTEISDFIIRDYELEKIIYDLPKIITNELDYNQISLDFMKETDPNEKILEIIIYSQLKDEIMLKKEDLISDGIIDNYPKPMNEYIILVESYDR
ncbi:hypothetical protein [Methanobrevibacter sp.]|uniref:hypothetical protein n=1 Tax=Methanobrevibacter sp. TaxID=66852 RepID=UPI00388E8CF3